MSTRIPPLAGLAVPLALALSCALAPTARADQLDESLVGKAPQLLKSLQDEKVQNVGVLPFRVKKGPRPESFIAGPINAGMATRVENALIMVEDPRHPLGVIRDAAGTASRAKVGAWYTRENEREKLFKLDYNLAWGDRKVKADAFLTGLIENTGDRETTKVTIQAFYKKDPRKLVEVARFTCDTDRSVLSDLGYNFALSRSALDKHRSTASRDKVAADLVKRRDVGQPIPPEEGQNVSPENVAGLSVEVRYNGSPVAIKPFSEGAKGNEYFIPPITAGTTFQLLLTNNGKAPGKIGAVVKVNGESTWQQEKGDSLKLRKWLYAPEKTVGRPDTFDGYYIALEGKNLLPFKLLSGPEAEARAAQMGDRVGWIDIDVFWSGPTQDDRMVISTRGALPRSRVDRAPAKPATLQQAQAQLYNVNRIHRLDKDARAPKARVIARGEGGLLVPDETPRESDKIELGVLPNPVLVASIHIKYYDADRTPMTISK